MNFKLFFLLFFVLFLFACVDDSVSVRFSSDNNFVAVDDDFVDENNELDFNDLSVDVNLCDSVECSDFEFCVNGVCVERELVPCESNEKRVDGVCVLKSCSDFGGQECVSGFSCSNETVKSSDSNACCIGSCVVDNSCDFVFCGKGKECINGECVDACKNVSCGNGEDCVDGECVVSNSFLRVKNGFFVLNGSRFKFFGVNYLLPFKNSRRRELFSTGLISPQQQGWEEFRSNEFYAARRSELISDFNLMHKIGINSVRVWLPSSMEFEENNFDLVYCDRLNELLRIAGENDLGVIVVFPWLNDWEWFKQVEWPSWLGEVWHEKSKRMFHSSVINLIQQCNLSENKNLFAYDLRNEPQIGGLIERVGDEELNKWGDWVREKYGSISVAEQEWGFVLDENCGSTNNELCPPSESQLCVDGVWSKMSLDYKKFYFELFNKSYSELVNKIKKIDPNHLITMGAITGVVFDSMVGEATDFCEDVTMIDAIEFYLFNVNNFDFYSFHLGLGEKSIQDLIDLNLGVKTQYLVRLFKSIGKPVIAEEFWMPKCSEVNCSDSSEEAQAFMAETVLNAIKSADGDGALWWSWKDYGDDYRFGLLSKSNKKRLIYFTFKNNSRNYSRFWRKYVPDSVSVTDFNSLNPMTCFNWQGYRDLISQGKKPEIKIIK